MDRMHIFLSSKKVLKLIKIKSNLPQVNLSIDKNKKFVIEERVESNQNNSNAQKSENFEKIESKEGMSTIHNNKSCYIN
jgi:hypothetical protein